MPAGGHTPPPYGYATPAPQPHHDRSGSPLALIILGIVAVLGIAAAVAAAAGVFSKESAPTSSTTAHTGATTRGSKARSSPQGHPQKPVKPPAGSTSCASGLWVNEHTSCPFAENTQSAYAEAGGANKTQVYSPVTGRTYEMTCSGTALVTCKGGHDARVYFSSAKASGQNTTPVAPPEPEPEPTPEPSNPGGGAATTSCDQNISVNRVTTCPFAENVFIAYWEEYEAVGESPYLFVEAFSETTGESYGMDCYDDADFVECTGGTEALVTFPMQAVRKY
jgi:hypothetical protein